MIRVERAFTLQQPHASALAAAVKDAENRPELTAALFRTVPTHAMVEGYFPIRPDLVLGLHAGAEFYRGEGGIDAELARVRERWLGMPRTEDLPRGMLLGAVQFGAASRLTTARAIMSVENAVPRARSVALGPPEEFLRVEVARHVVGSPWTAGPWVLVPRRVWQLTEPVGPVRGMLGLWRLTEEHAELLTQLVNTTKGVRATPMWPARDDEALAFVPRGVR